MSVSLWAYDPERCDGQVCSGDCDNCMLDELMDDEEEKEIEKELRKND